MIPFTLDQFFEVFERYNLTVWPAQLFLYAAGILTICLALKRRSDLSKSISFLLCLFWMWMGVVYHLLFFSSINGAALCFGAFFILQGILFFVAGVLEEELQYRFRPDLLGVAGSAFLVYALILYPALGFWLGHRYPTAPTFGLPCPTTIFTFGMLLWTVRRPPLYLLPIPLVWSFIGTWGAISLDVTEDFGLLPASLIGSLMTILIRRRYVPALAERGPAGIEACS